MSLINFAGRQAARNEVFFRKKLATFLAYPLYLFNQPDRLVNQTKLNTKILNRFSRFGTLDHWSLHNQIVLSGIRCLTT
jgi:hypothetical protein